MLPVPPAHRLTDMLKQNVAIVGAGIGGLSAALAIADAGTAEVTVFEAGERVGGRIDSGPFAGLDHIDAGPDAFLARVPEAVGLATRVGLGDALVSPEPVGAAVWYNGLQPIPEGLLLGLPGKIMPLATSRLLSWKGKLRAGLEPLIPRTSIEPDSVGAFVRARFGNEVQERLVDALVGSIYATDTDNFSLAEVPQLHAVAAKNRSMLLAARRQRPPAGGTATAAASPVFAVPRDGVHALIAAIANAATAAGVEIKTSCAVERIERIAASDEGAASKSWAINGEPFDAVILATPPAASAMLIADAVPDTASLLHQAEAADVIMVTLHVPAEQWPKRLSGLSGYLVPKPVQRWVTAVSFGSQKWAHWRPPSGGEILRVSLGRDGREVLQLSDEQVVAAVLEDLETHLEIEFSPLEVRVTRWPGAFAQYRPRHAAWVESVERSLPPGLFVTGSGYRGIGIPACVRDGTKTAAQSSTFLNPEISE